MDGPAHDATTTFSFTADERSAMRTHIEPDRVEVCCGGALLGSFRLVRHPAAPLTLDLRETRAEREGLAPLMAALEGLFAANSAFDRIGLIIDAGSRLRQACLMTGLAVPDVVGDLVVPATLFWQRPEPWLRTSPGVPYPQMHVMTGGIRHPRRRPKPQGTVYARYIPWLGQSLSLRAFDPAIDLDRFHRWMNDPRVARIWDEAGDRAKHEAYAAKLAADPHMLPLVGCFDGNPFAYFELYWAKENRLGPHYDAQDYDRGWHVLVGEEAYRGRAWISAWLPSLMHYMFLDDPRTQRIVGEPAASHGQQIRNLERSGFAKLKHVDFPHKRAMLVMLLRERYFGDRLWLPASSGNDPRHD